MADIVFVAVAMAFFAFCALYVHWCDRIIGNDQLVVGRQPDVDPEQITAEQIPEVAA